MIQDSHFCYLSLALVEQGSFCIHSLSVDTLADTSGAYRQHWELGLLPSPHKANITCRWGQLRALLFGESV